MASNGDRRSYGKRGHSRRRRTSAFTTTSTSTSSLSISVLIYMTILILAISYSWMLLTSHCLDATSSTTIRRRSMVMVDAFQTPYPITSIRQSKYQRLWTTTRTLRRDCTLYLHSKMPIQYPPLQHRLRSRSDTSYSFSTTQRLMVNFGPYGDYLNRKINDDNDENQNGNESSKQNSHHHDPTVPSPPSSSTNPWNTAMPHNTLHTTGNDITPVVFVHAHHTMDDLYYYTSGSIEETAEKSDREQQTTQNSISDYKNPQSTAERPWASLSSSPLSLPPLPQSLDSMDANVAAGTYRILQIPTLSLKPGGLRLFLVMYILGAIPAMIRNNNKLLIWKVDRPSTDEYVIDLYYHDHSAILSIELIPSLPSSNADTFSASSTTTPGVNPTNITTTTAMINIHRIGSSPSSMYRIHEATIIQGILHELITCATDPVVPNLQDRLLTISNTTLQEIHSICSTFPFG